MSPHEEFLELAAAAAVGELTQEERQKLEEHLAICSPCKASLKQFEATILAAVPALASDVPPNQDEDDSTLSLSNAETRLFERLNRRDENRRTGRAVPGSEQDVGHRVYFPSRIRWDHLGLTSAAIMLFAFGLAVSAYRSGRKQQASSARKADASGALQTE